MERNPDWYQFDLKFNYRLGFTDRIAAQFFLDVYNITNNQAFYQVEKGDNNQEFAYLAQPINLIHVVCISEHD